MTDIIGPASAANSLTTRPVETRSFLSDDTYFGDCSSPTADDGTDVEAAFLNGVVVALRKIWRMNGNRTDGVTPIVAEDGTDDDGVKKAIQNLVQRGQLVYGADSGAVNVLVVALSPALVEYKTGLRILVKITTANTGAATLNVNGLGAKSIKRADGLDLSSGDLKVGQIIGLVYDGTVFRFVGSARSEVSQLVMSPLTTVKFTTPGSTTFTVPAGVTSVLAREWAGGGGGGYANGTDRAPSGGASGGYAERRFIVAPGDVGTIVVGAGGVGGSATPAQAGQPGLNSTVTFGGVTVTANGGGGGLNASSSNTVANSPSGGSFSNADFGIRGEDGHIGIAVGVGSTASGGSGGAAPLGGGETPGGRGNPGAGSIPGGGGGATSDSGIAGATGARGEVHIVYATPGV